MTQYQRHAEATSECRAPAEAVFAHLDNQEKLGAHMSKPSWMMLGGHMRYELDEARGQRVGSVIRMAGSVAWLRLAFGPNGHRSTIPAQRIRGRSCASLRTPLCLRH